MQVVVSADHSVTASQALAGEIERSVSDALMRFAGRITRVEAHLGEAAAHPGKQSKRCSLEAHVAGLGPVAVQDSAPSVDLAVDGAIDKLWRALDREFGRAEAAAVRGPP